MKTHFSGIFKPRKHGKETIDGIKYSISYSQWIVPIFRITKFIQKTLWFCGIAVHDPLFEECTPDFNCCCNIGRKAFLKIPQRETLIK